MRYKLIIFFVLLYTSLFSITAFAWEGTVLTFSENQKSVTFGAPNGVSRVFYEIAYSDFVDNNNFLIYDKNGNLLGEGSGGSFSVESGVFPITFVAQATRPDGWRIDLRLTGTAEQKDYTGILEGISGKLGEMNDFLTNPQPFYDSIGNLENAVNNMQNKGFMGQIKSIKDNLGMLGTKVPDKDGLPTDLTFKVTIPGVITFNALDLSHFTKLIWLIKQLMIAILWVSLIIYLVNYLMPRFKV